MDISVEHPEGTDQIDKGHRCLPFAVKDVNKSIEFRGEADCKVNNCGKDEAKGHHQPLVVLVGDESVYKAGDAVYYAV